jgi:hypothetical protein
MGQNADLGAVVFLSLGQPRTWRHASKGRACPQRRTGPTAVRRFFGFGRRKKASAAVAAASLFDGGAPTRLLSAWRCPLTQGPSCTQRLGGAPSRIHRPAWRAPCTLRSQRRRWTTQYSVLAGSLRRPDRSLSRASRQAALSTMSPVWLISDALGLNHRSSLKKNRRNGLA